MHLDHLIAVVPDLPATHARLRELGFDEAWPPGPFWPAATTSGIALGNANLELVQPDAGVPKARIETLVLAPATLEEGFRMMRPFDTREREKVEADPRLLALRGFPSEMCTKPQSICDNIYPHEDQTNYPFFLCLYAPFLKARLAPSNFASPRGPLIGLSLAAPDPAEVRSLFEGQLGAIELSVELAETPEVVSILFADGSALTKNDL